MKKLLTLLFLCVASVEAHIYYGPEVTEGATTLTAKDKRFIIEAQSEKTDDGVTVVFTCDQQCKLQQVFRNLTTGKASHTLQVIVTEFSELSDGTKKTRSTSNLIPLRPRVSDRLSINVDGKTLFVDDEITVIQAPQGR